MFDAKQRLVVCNYRYAEIFGLPARLTESGASMLDILNFSVTAGVLKFEDCQAYIRDCCSIAQADKPAKSVLEFQDGRVFRVAHAPVDGGGAVATYEDITEHTRIDTELVKTLACSIDARQASSTNAGNEAERALEEARTEHREPVRLLFDGNPVPMWIFDSETLRFLAVNEAAIAHYGYSRDQFLAMTLLDIRTEKDVAGAFRGRKWIYENGSTRRHTTADGNEILVAIYARSIVYEGRNGRLASVIDVTERVRVADELSRAQEFLHLVIESIPEAILVKDVQTRQFTMVNHAAEELLGIPRSQFIGRTAEDTYPIEYAKLVRREDDELLRRGELFIDNHKIELLGKEPRVVTIDRKLLKNAAGAPQFMLAVIRDITERTLAEERIAHLARHDSLTDLPNRTLFNERLASCLERAKQTGARFAVLCIDLDRLKEVNDVFGHAAGDQLLREVSRRLLGAAGEAFLARLGGDEFALIAEEEGRALDIAPLTDRLLGAVDDEVTFQGAWIRAGLSIGVAIFPDDARDLTTLLANADAALYRAKAEGRGVTRFFKRDMDKRLRERHALRHDLSLAIEHGELAMVYQPQAKVTGEIVGFEALLRWSHPSRGSVPPSEFIPVAEDSWLIVQIGEWALRDACREAASWPNRLGVAVNLSPVQFQHGDLPSLVNSILLETGLAAERLELEITEGVLIEDSSRGLSVLRRLKALGVRIAMDDFGKGYSSLSYLQSFPFDKIKIDRAFVSQVTQNPQSAAIVRAVLGLARGLGLPVLAEGVESKEELAFLAAEACNLVQGYFIGKPRSIDHYAKVVGFR